MVNRIYNFNAGPAALPLPVLEEIRDEFLNYKGSGMSITEVSHRSKWFDSVINEAAERTKRLLGLDDKFQVLFCSPVSRCVCHNFSSQKCFRPLEDE